MARRRHDAIGTFTVAGDARKMPSAGAAFSLAQHLATSHGGPILMDVYDNGTKIGRVERHEDGSITTTTTKEG